MSARDVSRAGLELDNFIQNSAQGGMDDADWAEFARHTIDLAKAEIHEEIREEIRSRVKPEALSDPAAPQQRWEIMLDMRNPIDRAKSLGDIIIGSHETERDAYYASSLLNTILGCAYLFTVTKV